MIIFAKAQHIKAAHLCQAQNDARYYLNALHFIGNQIQATDGHRAFRLTHDLINAPETGLLLKVSKVPTMRGIETAAIDVDAGIVYWLPLAYDKPEDLKDVDLQKARVAVGTVDLVDGRYPDLRRVFTEVDSKREGVKVIGFNVEYFAVITRICKALQMKSSIVKITLQDATTAAFVEIKSHNGVAEYAVMPARL